MNIRPLLLLLSCALVACSSEDPPETGVVIILGADNEIQPRITALTLRIAGGASVANLATILDQDINPDGLWPLRTVLAPNNGDASRVFRYEATAYEGNRTIGLVRVIDRYTEGLVREIVLRFDDGCETEHAFCTPDETCQDGACVVASRLGQTRDAGPVLDDAGPFLGDAGPGDVPPPIFDSGPDSTFPEDVGPPSCGDGFINGMEQCDDGNDWNNDGCNNSCEMNTRCDNTCSTPNDSDCDDGRVGADFSGCALGTDCDDCGPLFCEDASECPNLQCANNYCTRLTSCMRDPDCTSAEYCVFGKCVLRGTTPYGDGCTAGDQCVSGACIDEYCSKRCDDGETCSSGNLPVCSEVLDYCVSA